MKENYIAEYQENYQINLNVMQDNIKQFKETIKDKEEQSVELQKIREQHESMMNRFIDMMYRAYMYKKAMRALKDFQKRKRQKNKLGAYTRNFMHRYRMRKIYK